MLFKQLIFAASAAAFLVVPEISQAEEEAFKALPVDVYTNDIPNSAMAQTVEVPCSKCKGQDTHLAMDFSVENGHRLTLNGYELYPNADPWRGDLTAEVINGNGKKKEQMLGYSLAVGPQAYDTEQSLEIINVGLHIIEVGGRFVDGIPTIDVKLIKAATGEILIGAVDAHTDTQPECTDIWCRIKQSLDQAWNDFDQVWDEFKSCSKGAVEQGSGGGKDTIELDGQRPYDDYPAYDDVDFDWADLMENIVFSVVLPVLTGITAGICVAVFAMGVGSLIAVIVRSRRRCHKANRRSKEAATEAAAEEEKAGLIGKQDFEEPPPTYAEQQTSPSL